MKAIMGAPPDTPAKVSSRIRQHNQQRILAAAEIEFAQHGFNSARMDAIAQAAGLPKANLHYYFKTKKSLYQSLLSTCLNAWRHHASALQVDQSPAHALPQYILQKIEFAQQRPHTSRLLAVELMDGGTHLTPDQQQVLQHWLEHLTQIFSAWSNAGTLRAIEPRALIILLWGSTRYCTDFQPQVSSSTGETQEAEMLLGQQLAQLILHGCLPPHLPHS